MTIDRSNPDDPHQPGDPYRPDTPHRPDTPCRPGRLVLLVGALAMLLGRAAPAQTRSSPTDPTGQSEAAADDVRSDPRAQVVITQVLDRMVFGPAFAAQLRQRIWTSGREVVGVGTYEQAGQGSGHFNLQLTMHDGDGKHTLRQISDGRLAWTRSEIAASVLLRRVDVRILEQRIRDGRLDVDYQPRQIVGGLTELVHSIRRDYALRVSSAKLIDPDGRSEQPMLVISGSLRPEVRRTILETAGRTDWPALCPSTVRVLVAATPDADTNFGEGLPRRIDFFSDPVPGDSAPPRRRTAGLGGGPRVDDPGDGTVDGGGDQGGVDRDAAGPVGGVPADQPAAAAPQGRLISLLELYSVRPISMPAKERFHYQSQDADNHYVNETDRYLMRYGL